MVRSPEPLETKRRTVGAVTTTFSSSRSERAEKFPLFQPKTTRSSPSLRRMRPSSICTRSARALGPVTTTELASPWMYSTSMLESTLRVSPPVQARVRVVKGPRSSVRRP